MAKRPVPLYDFKAFGAAIKAARKEYGESRKTVSDALYIQSSTKRICSLFSFINFDFTSSAG